VLSCNETKGNPSATRCLFCKHLCWENNEMPLTLELVGENQKYGKAKEPQHLNRFWTDNIQKS
jgi:hypothetical protein